ncbi:spore maturation protein CgeB [Paenibacillus shirakamiensis]|uniref:Spore maturation protein CgeB n=1 Tax=Paenibacillus shirakamiensis TaxID=1265935 RepID=A0ABS4JLZ6_9BACL|nr:glycosyltransferase [Paenibacillus shirakamiensis]MBP2002135.1 spore maturation protein CgeB [Paenibacillus shirakamiensis]
MLRRRAHTSALHAPIEIGLDPLNKGRAAGRQDGYDEGYLRGRADVIVNRHRPSFPIRNLKVLYVASGKGFPYSPIDEAVLTTLRTLTTEVIVSDVRQPIGQLAAEHRPDLVLVLDGMELAVSEMEAVRAQGIRSAVWLTDDPYYTDITMNIAGYYDHVFTLELNSVAFYQQMGCANVHYLPFGAFTDHYQPVRTLSKIRREISFIGSAYWNRVHFFSPVIKELMNDGLSINGIWWDRLPEFSEYSDRIELGKWMGPEETAETYSGSKIVINLHRAHDDDTVNNNTVRLSAASPNPRTFEISACATLQLVDRRSDLARFYIPGVEIETFDSPQEMMDKVRFYLTHEKERQKIALRALERTYREHTYANRVNQLLATIFG